MIWQQFLQEKKQYEEAWQHLKESFEGDARAFLETSSLVLTYEGGQMPFALTDVSVIRREHPEFLESNGYQVEIRFPTVDMEHIQAVKQSAWCGACLCRACIRVALRKPSLNHILKRSQ